MLTRTIAIIFAATLASAIGCGGSEQARSEHEQGAQKKSAMNMGSNAASRRGPEQAVTGTDSAGMTAIEQDSTKSLYTCSMHPEVVRDHPGKCPKCGMFLVAKAGDSDSTGHGDARDIHTD